MLPNPREEQVCEPHPCITAQGHRDTSEPLLDKSVLDEPTRGVGVPRELPGTDFTIAVAGYFLGTLGLPATYPVSKLHGEGKSGSE